jgi:hypothetical protein
VIVYDIDQGADLVCISHLFLESNSLGKKTDPINQIYQSRCGHGKTIFAEMREQRRAEGSAPSPGTKGSSGSCLLPVSEHHVIFSYIHSFKWYCSTIIAAVDKIPILYPLGL